MVENIYNQDVQIYHLRDLVEIRSSRRSVRVDNYPFKDALPYMDIQTLESGIASKYAEKGGAIVNTGDLLMVKDGYSSGKVYRGKEGIAGSTFTVLSPKSEDLREDYLYCYLTYCYDDFQKRKRGTTVGHLDMNYLKKLLVPLPNVRTQQEIAGKYQRIETLAAAIRDKALHLKELSVDLGNKELKKKSEQLIIHVEMTTKAWLHQTFSRTRL